jgi:hypothetical protein
VSWTDGDADDELTDAWLFVIATKL